VWRRAGQGGGEIKGHRTLSVSEIVAYRAMWRAGCRRLSDIFKTSSFVLQSVMQTKLLMERVLSVTVMQSVTQPMTDH